MAYFPVPNYPFFDNGVTTTRDVSQLDANFLYVSGKMVSVLDYGADATGVVDSTAAFNAAVGTANRHIYVPPGTYLLSSTVTLAAGVWLQGASRNSVNIHYSSLSTKCFVFGGDGCALSDMSITIPTGTALSGCYGIYTSNVSPATSSNWSIFRVFVGAFYNGIFINSSSIGNLFEIDVQNCTSHGIVGGSAQGFWTNVNVLSNAGNGVTLSPVSSAAPPWITGLQSFNNGGWDIESSDGIQLIQSFLNNSKSGNIHISGASGDYGYIAHVNCQFAGNSSSYGVNTSAPAIQIDGGTGPIVGQDIHIFNPQGNGIEVNSTGNIFIGGRILGCGQGAVVGKVFSIISTTSPVNVSGFTLGSAVKMTAASQSIIRGNTITVTDATNPALYIVSGTIVTIDHNKVINSAGVAFQADSGVTLTYGVNDFITGTVTNNATFVGTSWPDYQQPAITPVLSFATPGDLAVVYTVQQAAVTKSGRMVAVSFTIAATPTYTTASGGLIITGLPNAAMTLTGAAFATGMYYSNLTLTAGFTQVTPYINSTSSTIRFVQSGSTKAATDITTTNAPSGTAITLVGTVIYFASN